MGRHSGVRLYAFHVIWCVMERFVLSSLSPKHVSVMMFAWPISCSPVDVHRA